jgi:hypothetical protein
MDAGSLIRLAGSTICATAVIIGGKVLIDHAVKSISLDASAAALDSEENKLRKDQAINLTKNCKDMRQSNDELEAYIQLLKQKADNAKSAFEKQVLLKRAELAKKQQQESVDVV